MEESETSTPPALPVTLPKARMKKVSIGDLNIGDEAYIDVGLIDVDSNGLMFVHEGIYTEPLDQPTGVGQDYKGKIKRVSGGVEVDMLEANVTWEYGSPRFDSRYTNADYIPVVSLIGRPINKKSKKNENKKVKAEDWFILFSGICLLATTIWGDMTDGASPWALSMTYVLSGLLFGIFMYRVIEVNTEK